jgi:hypothetical protein
MKKGFILVNNYLQSSSHPHTLAGEIALIPDYPRPKVQFLPSDKENPCSII